MSPATAPFRRARRWFWSLVLTAVLAMGALYAALGARPGPVTGLAVAVTSLVLIAATTQATRLVLALDRARRSAGEHPTSQVGPGRAAADGTVVRPRGESLTDLFLGRRAGSNDDRRTMP